VQQAVLQYCIIEQIPADRPGARLCSLIPSEAMSSPSIGDALPMPNDASSQ
jgi:hypothetical protein